MVAPRWLVLSFAALTFPAAMAAAAATPPSPLAIIDRDTLTTVDLAIELSLMRQRTPEGVAAELPPPAAVLRRLIQNRLIVHEGYRMGLDQQFAVKNQVTEAIRTQCTKVLLDSVAASVPAATKELKEARRQAVKDYIEGLQRTYKVTVDRKLLASLDYGSADPAVQAQLRDGEAALAVIPPGPIKVKNLSRAIRFAEFHGLTGKPDAAERRDRIFDELLVESLLRYQARIQGLEDAPDLRRFRGQLERQLVFEETLKVLLDIPFAPTAAEVEGFYTAHLADVTPEAGIKVQSVKVTTAEAARTLRERWQQGTKLSWLRKNTPEVVDGPDPFPSEFFAPSLVRIQPENVVVGKVLEPFEVPGGWVVVMIDEIQRVEPTPLDQCRDTILRMMKAEQTSRQMTEFLNRLEAAAAIRTVPGAEDVIAREIARTRGGSATGATN